MKPNVVFREMISGIYIVESVIVGAPNVKDEIFVASSAYTEGQFVTNLEVVKEINNPKSYVRVLDKDWSIAIEQLSN